jgi:hypothetical protein
VREAGSRHAYRDPLAFLPPLATPAPEPPAAVPAPSPAPAPPALAPTPRSAPRPGRLPAPRRVPSRSGTERKQRRREATRQAAERLSGRPIRARRRGHSSSPRSGPGRQSRSGDRRRSPPPPGVGPRRRNHPPPPAAAPTSAWPWPAWACCSRPRPWRSAATHATPAGVGARRSRVAAPE